MHTPFDRINSTTPYQNIDTLNFTQVSQSAMFNSSIILGSLDNKDKRHILTTNLSYQQSVNRQEGVATLENSSFYQGGLIYAYSLAPKNLSMTGTILGSYSKLTATEEMLMLGPVVGISKSFFDKKFTTNTSISYNTTYRNGDFTGDVFSVRLGGGYSHQKVHRINFSFCFMQKSTKTEINTVGTFEFSGNISYTYSIAKQ